MASTAVTIIRTVVVVLVILALAYLTWRVTHKKWKCTEGGCETDIDGDYASKSECMEACKQKQAMRAMVAAHEDDEPDAWACSVSGNNYQCIRSDEGEYTSQEACQKNCSAPSYYYPQTMLYRPVSLWDHPRRPRYWWPRSGRRWRRRNRSLRKK